MGQNLSDGTDEQQAPAVNAGRRFTSSRTGRLYEIGKRLGVGGFGAVYLCHVAGRRTQRFAAKFTFDQPSWVREVYFGELVEGIEGAIQIYDAFPVAKLDRSGRQGFMAVMDLAEGGDLYDFLDQPETQLTETKIVAITRRLLHTLSHLHDGSAVHRDVTPMNVFLDTRGNLLLGDFGIARHRGRGPAVNASKFNYEYCPPEVGHDKWLWSPRQDIWQVGQLMAMMLQHDPRAIIKPGRVRDLGCSPWLAEVIYRSIGPEDERYFSADEMLAALRAKTLALQILPRARPKSIRGMRLVFTAGIPSLPWHQASRLAKKAGAIVLEDVTYGTDLLVIGGQSPAYAAGAAGTKILRALALNEGGARIRTITGVQFQQLV